MTQTVLGHTFSNPSPVSPSKYTSGTSSFNAGMGVSILGTVLDIGSQIYGGFLQNKVYSAQANLAEAQGNYDSSVQEFNAAVSRANALAIRTVADLDIGRQRVAATRFKSGQIASYAKAGVKQEGSPLLVMIDSAAEANLDIAITDYNAKIGMLQTQSQEKQYGISSQIAKSNAETSSNLLKATGKFQKEQSYGKSANTLLSQVSSFAR